MEDTDDIYQGRLNRGSNPDSAAATQAGTSKGNLLVQGSI